MTADIGAEIWSLIGKIVTAGGGGAVVAYAIFRHFGKTWIQHEFSKELEAAKSEISILSARRLKLYDREYIVFPELWSRLNKVFGSVSRAVMSFRQYPDFQRMEESERTTWLAHSDLSASEKSYFTSETDKNNAYNKILEFRDLNEANKDRVEFHTYFENNRIFLSPDIKEKLRQIDDLLWHSWVAKKMDLQGFGEAGSIGKAWEILDKKIKPLMVEIEALVQARLFPERTDTRK